MPVSHDAVKLQLAMAFGQGSGCMIAEPEALEQLLNEQSSIIAPAIATWHTSHWAFLELVRRLGHLSATRAGMQPSAVIRWEHIQPSLAAVMIICPCFDAPQNV